jgi:hypothetical protein
VEDNSLETLLSKAEDAIAPSVTPSGRIYVGRAPQAAPVAENNLPEQPLTPGTGQTTTSQPVSATAETPPTAQPMAGNTLPQAPTDDTVDPLQRMDQLAAQAMAERGIKNYVPPIEHAVTTEEGKSSLQQSMQDIAAGFNYELGKVLDVPQDTINRGLALLGLDYMSVNGKPMPTTVQALNRMGIPAYAIDNMANKMGQEALPALATWAAIQISAPYMAANQGVSSAAYITKDIGEWALKHPVLGMWLGQTSSAGGVVGKQVGDNPYAELGGELAGGAVGSGTVRAGGKLVSNFATRAVGKGANWLADGLPTGIANAIKKWNPLYQAPNIASSPVAELGVGKDTMHNFAENQVAGLKMQMDDAVTRAINSVPRTGPSNVQQQVMHSNLQEAEKISNRLVEKAWERVDSKQRIPVSDMFNKLIAFRQSMKDRPSVTPSKFIKDGLRLSTNLTTRDPATGQLRTVKAMPTVERMRDFSASIRNEIVREQASDAPRDGYIRALNQIRTIVEENIYDHMSGNTALEQARAATTAHHDMFSRGPVADLLAKKYRGDWRINPSESVDALINKEGGVQSVRDMVKTLSSNANILPDEKKMLATLQKDMENAIRNAFREEAASGGAKGATKYVGNVQYGIKSLSKVGAELQLAVNKMNTALEVKHDIEKSALARFSETDPEKAVANLFNQKNPAAIARQLMMHFKGDPDALAGLRNQTIAHLLQMAKQDPVRMQELLKTTRIGDLLQTVLSSDQSRRLNKIVADSVRLTTGEDKGFARTNILKFTMLGRVVGAWIGRQMPGTTLQGQGIFSRVGSRMAESILRSTPPDKLMIQAIIDPHFEHLLYSRLPVSTKEMKAAQKSYRRATAVLNTTRDRAVNAMFPQPDDSLNNSTPQP